MKNKEETLRGFNGTKIQVIVGNYHILTALTAIISNWNASWLDKDLKFNCGFTIPIKLSKQIQIYLKHSYEKRPHVNERILESNK